MSAPSQYIANDGRVSSCHDLYPQVGLLRMNLGENADEGDDDGDTGTHRLHARNRTSTVAGSSAAPSMREVAPATPESIRRPSSRTACRAPAKGVIRGLHVRVGAGENKLVRCSSGAIFDVVVDLRPGRRPIGSGCPSTSNGDSQRSVYIPAGCAHGFQALTEPADTSYRIDREHDPSEDLTIAYDDPELAVPWPLPVTLMSDSDRTARRLDVLSSELSRINAIA